RVECPQETVPPRAAGAQFRDVRRGLGGRDAGLGVTRARGARPARTEGDRVRQDREVLQGRGRQAERAPAGRGGGRGGAPPRAGRRAATGAWPATSVAVRCGGAGCRASRRASRTSSQAPVTRSLGSAAKSRRRRIPRRSTGTPIR